MISNNTLARLRRVYERALIDTCTIQAATVTNGATGSSVSFANTQTGVKCLVTPAMNKRLEMEALLGGGVESQQYQTVRLPYDTEISVTDRILTSDSRTLDVVTITVRSIQVGTQVLCKQVG